MEVSLLKRIGSEMLVVAHEQWWHLDDSVEVELTSEDPAVANRARSPGSQVRRLACGCAGAQTLSLVWREPTPIKRIRLVYEEHSRAVRRSSRFARSQMTGDARLSGSSSHSHHLGRPLNARSIRRILTPSRGSNSRSSCY